MLHKKHDTYCGYVSSRLATWQHSGGLLCRFNLCVLRGNWTNDFWGVCTWFSLLEVQEHCVHCVEMLLAQCIIKYVLPNSERKRPYLDPWIYLIYTLKNCIYSFTKTHTEYWGRMFFNGVFVFTWQKKTVMATLFTAFPNMWKLTLKRLILFHKLVFQWHKNVFLLAFQWGVFYRHLGKKYRALMLKCSHFS